MADAFLTESGQIRDPDKAHDIANLEIPARERELELKRQDETNLTKEERENLAIMAKYSEKYPDAFEKRLEDGSGREILVVDTNVFSGHSLDGVDGVLYFTQEGFFRLAGSNFGNFWLTKLPADKAIKLAHDIKDSKPDIRGNYRSVGIDFEARESDGRSMDVRAGGMRLDVIGNKSTRDQIREIMVARQQSGEERNKQRQEADAAREIQSVLADL